MITIWIHKNKIGNFMSVMDRVDFYEEIELEYFTYQPKNFKEYLQLFITYEEYIELEEKKNVVK